jgi:hypothetical protein
MPQRKIPKLARLGSDEQEGLAGPIPGILIVDEIAVPQTCPFTGGTGTATLSGWRQTSDTGTPDVKEAEDFGGWPVDRTAKAVGSRKLSLRSEKLGSSGPKVVTGS